MSSEVLTGIAIALAGFAGSSLCSGMETGSYAVNRVRVRARAAKSRGYAMLDRELGRQDRLLATLLLGNNAANYAGTLGVTALLATAGLSEGAQIAASALLTTTVLLIFGESVPKELFRTRADSWMPRVAGVLLGMRLFTTVTLLLPIVLVFGRFATKLVGSGETARGTRARLREMIEESAGYGVIRAGQHRLADRALLLEQRRVGELMTPWKHSVSVHADWDAPRVTERLRGSPRSWVAVVDARGSAIGVASVIDLLTDPDATPGSKLEEAVVLDPADTPRDAIRRLHAASVGLALVKRGNRTLGVITRADLVAPLLEDPDADERRSTSAE